MSKKPTPINVEKKSQAANPLVASAKAKTTKTAVLIPAAVIASAPHVAASATPVASEVATAPAAKKLPKPPRTPKTAKVEAPQVPGEYTPIISPARIRRHMDGECLNMQVDAAIEKLKEIPAFAKYQFSKRALANNEGTGKLPKKPTDKPAPVPLTSEEIAAHNATMKENLAVYSDVHSQIAALNHVRVRFSNNAQNIVGFVCDKIVAQVTEFAGAIAIASSKKTLKVDHIYGNLPASAAKFTLFPCIASLPAYREESRKFAELAQTSIVQNAVSAAVKNSKKKSKKEEKAHNPAKPGKGTNKAAPAIPAAPVTAKTQLSFKYYVGKVCHETIKKHAEFANLRISEEFRAHIATLIKEFIIRVSSIVWTISRCTKFKTVNKGLIMCALEILLDETKVMSFAVSVEQTQIIDPAALVEERARKKAAKDANLPYVGKKEDLAKINGHVAKYVLNTPVFTELEKMINVYFAEEVVQKSN